eukprot:TRINITY_DN16484_c0_g1_i1.p1 TRINITY_DN16484_c0_g1~~TRINITY_DN16484_c0_g1_i1.p1  ORF type:complete len:161 (+),score=34.64 TRINITY_DN16484_c0_g1_i1:67-549(+)
MDGEELTTTTTTENGNYSTENRRKKIVLSQKFAKLHENHNRGQNSLLKVQTDLAILEERLDTQIAQTTDDQISQEDHISSPISRENEVSGIFQPGSLFEPSVLDLSTYLQTPEPALLDPSFFTNGENSFLEEKSDFISDSQNELLKLRKSTTRPSSSWIE